MRRKSKKSLLPIAVSLGLLLSVLAKIAAAQSNPLHVIGSGVRAAVPGDPASQFTFSFDARSASAQANGVEGTFSGSFMRDALFRTAPGNFASFAGVVTCLQVNGDMATIGGVITSGYGYDSDLSGPEGFSQDKRDLTGDWFITTAQDPKRNESLDALGYVDWGDRAYFVAIGFSSFSALCNDPVPDLGTAQFPLVSGDLKIR
jgi:hypothetical protein